MDILDNSNFIEYLYRLSEQGRYKEPKRTLQEQIYHDDKTLNIDELAYSAGYKRVNKPYKRSKNGF